MRTFDAETDLAQTWCDRCDQPATRSIELTTGERAFRCSKHAWLLVAPAGSSAVRKDRRSTKR